MWNSTIVVLAVLIVLLCASAAGMVLQRALKDRHKSRETADHIRLIISILVTFTAVLLGLLISNVKTSFDAFDSRLRGYVGDVTELDMRLREYGDDAAPIRANPCTYLAAAITGAWRNEPHPAGVYPMFQNTVSIEREPLGSLLLDADVAIRKLDPADHYHRRIADLLETRMTEMLARRQLLIETVHETVSWPLLVGMTAWLVVVFAVFGLISPRNAVVYATIVLCALSFGSAIFFILEFDTPLDGLIVVSSEPARDALRHLDAP
jgi:amino acid transporter